MVEDFKVAAGRESFQRRVSEVPNSPARPHAPDGASSVDWPSPVSSLGSPPTLAHVLARVGSSAGLNVDLSDHVSDPQLRMSDAERQILLSEMEHEVDSPGDDPEPSAGPDDAPEPGENPASEARREGDSPDDGPGRDDAPPRNYDCRLDPGDPIRSTRPGETREIEGFATGPDGRRDGDGAPGPNRSPGTNAEERADDDVYSDASGCGSVGPGAAGGGSARVATRGPVGTEGGKRPETPPFSSNEIDERERTAPMATEENIVPSGQTCVEHPSDIDTYYDDTDDNEDLNLSRHGSIDTLDFTVQDDDDGENHGESIVWAPQEPWEPFAPEAPDPYGSALRKTSVVKHAIRDLGSVQSGGLSASRSDNQLLLGMSDESLGAHKKHLIQRRATTDVAPGDEFVKSADAASASGSASGSSRSRILVEEVPLPPAEDAGEEEAETTNRAPHQHGEGEGELSGSRHSSRSRGRFHRTRMATPTCSEVSSMDMDSFASPTWRSKPTFHDSFSSLDSLASPTHNCRMYKDEPTAMPDDKIAQAASASDADGMSQFNRRKLMERVDSWASRCSIPNPDKKNSCRERRMSESSMSIDDVFEEDNNEGFQADGFQSSALANDVALHLEHSTRSTNTYLSSDGIDHIDPSATGEGQDDFDFVMNAYTKSIKCGHFDFHDDCAARDENKAWEGNDQVLAAKAYMGLGFSRQCKGELECSLDAYLTSLKLWEEEIGQDDPVNASLQFAVGTVLIEMQRQLEASDHFTKALHLFKCRDPNEDGTRASIASTEGMLFSVLGEADRAIKCFRQAVLLYKNSTQFLNLKFATVMFEMGSLFSQQGLYDDSANCFNFSLEIRQTLLGDSFVVARTHYSLGVTKASQELKESTDISSASHLEEALRICRQEFEGEHVQSAIIVHALGVLNERKGDFLAASTWFAMELNMRKILSGEDHETVASVSADLGTCYYNSGKYDVAISTFEDGLRIILLAENDRSLEVAETLYKIASCHDSLCNYDEALEKFNEVKKIRESLFGVGSSPVIQTMLRIGNILLCQGEVKKALDCFSEVLGIGYASDSVNAVEVANALYGRGCAQFCGFHLADAMKSFSESLNWKLAALGEDDPGLACIFYQMAHVYLEQSEPEEAITCFEEYARLQKLETQRNLHDNAEICYAEGIVAKLKGRQDAALSFYRQALTMFDTLFGGDHEKVASIHFDIGCVHSAMDDHEAALGHFQTSLLQRRKLLGGHVDVANVLYEMASIYSQQDSVELAVKCLTEADRIWKTKLRNNEKLTSVLLLSAKLWKSLQCYQAAEENFEKALEQAISLYGQEHELVASILLSLGEFLQEINQIQQSLFCFEESIKVRLMLFGPESPSVAEVEYSKGVALLFNGDFEDASNCLDRSLTIRKKHLGHMDSVIGDTLNTIGFLQLRMGNFSGEEALDPLTEALEIRRAVGNMSKVVSTLQNIGSVYKKRKQYCPCIETHAEILAVRQGEFGLDHACVADAWMNLGNMQTIASRLVEAMVSYEEALRVRTLVNGYHHLSVAQVLFKLGSLNSKQKNYTNAKQLFEEYLRIRAEEEDDPEEEMAQALMMMGDLQKETGEKSKAHINWTSAIEIYQQLGYPETHSKLRKLRARQKTVPIFGFGSRNQGGGDFSVRGFFGAGSTAAPEKKDGK